MTREDFETWAESPATQWVFKALEAAREAQRQHWLEMSWESGKADPALLSELRSRADAYMAIVETPYERFCEMLGVEPKEP